MCQPDYSQALTDIGQLLFNAASPCLGGAIVTDDRDPVNPGVQPDCVVVDVQTVTSGQETESPIPSCAMTNPTTPSAAPRPCWWVKANPAACTTATGLELRVERTSTPATETNVRVRCATNP